MSRLTIEAVYENGVLRPLHPLSLPEHTRLRITIDTVPQHPLAECIGILPDEDAEDMRQAIEQEFEQVNPDNQQEQAIERMLRQMREGFPFGVCGAVVVPFAQNDGISVTLSHSFPSP